jgi:hypothetical protein
MYGIKRGTLYNAEKLGFVRGVILRVTSKRKGNRIGGVH